MIKSAWIHSFIDRKIGYRYHQLLDVFQKDSLPLSSPPPPSLTSTSSKISPAVLFIIVILAVIFFVSGLLHLFVRFLIKKRPSVSPRTSLGTNAAINGDSDALQRQLQQLFHLHDSGLDQAFIDALPVFLYKEIVGAKEPFDCAVCLCEFFQEDMLRLLPICGHAFHLSCIETWLLSNSTCPLCRAALFAPGLAIENPMFDFNELREVEENPEEKPLELEENAAEKKVFPVRLGKFRTVSNGFGDVDGNHGNDGALRRKQEDISSSSNLDGRRCFSMGSYQYVVQEANLQVALNEVRKNGGDGKRLHAGSKGESFSVSKTWLWSNKKGKLPISIASNAEGILPWMVGRGSDQT